MGKAANQSLNSDNDYSIRLRNKVRNASPSATTICNAFRKAKLTDPSLIFTEWKRGYMAEYWRKKKKRAKNRK
jgi:hypothetical protein